MPYNHDNLLNTDQHSSTLVCSCQGLTLEHDMIAPIKKEKCMEWNWDGIHVIIIIVSKGRENNRI